MGVRSVLVCEAQVPFVSGGAEAFPSYFARHPNKVVWLRERLHADEG